MNGMQWMACTAAISLAADFQVNDQLGESEFDGDGPFDVVTCMFAMHYFFDAETRLRMFLRNVSNNLNPGGCTPVCMRVCVRVCLCVCVLMSPTLR